MTRPLGSTAIWPHLIFGGNLFHLASPLVFLIACARHHGLFRLSQQPLPYLDATLSPAERAHDLVGRMTLDEKANQLED